MTVRFVLGGGGAMGAYQAGMIAGLVAAGLAPASLHGCSAGALNAAFLAVDPGPDRADALLRWWLEPGTHSVLDATWWARLRGLAGAVATSRAGLFDPGPLRRLVAAHVPTHDLAELAIPITVTTTCLDCAAAVHHDRGAPGEVLAASCALPGLLPPVPLADGHLHVDGGVLSGVPLAPALTAAGPDDLVVVLDCGLAPVTSTAGSCAAYPPAGSACGLDVVRRTDYRAPVESSRGAMDVVLRAFTASRAVANRAAVEHALTDRRVRVTPHVADAWAAGLLDRLPTGPRDFASAGALARAGRAAAVSWLVGGGLDTVPRHGVDAVPRPLVEGQR